MTREFLKFLAAPAAAFLLLSPAGCVDKEKCEEAIRVTRDALAKDQPALARQWRDRAWNMCNDAATVGNLDKEILDKEAAIKKRAEDEQKAIADAAQKRMNTSTALWKRFDKLSSKKQTLAQLEKYNEKAADMKDGLPEQYAKQVEDFNEKQFEKRKKRIEKREKEKK